MAECRRRSFGPPPPIEYNQVSGRGVRRSQAQPITANRSRRGVDCMDSEKPPVARKDAPMPGPKQGGVEGTVGRTAAKAVFKFRQTRFWKSAEKSYQDGLEGKFKG